MNVLFLTIGRMECIESHAIYPDLLREFRNNGHNVYIVAPRERRTKLPTEIKQDNGVTIIHVKIGNITKCKTIEKGISTVLVETQFKQAIKKYLRDISFDLVLYSTPPITLNGVVKYVKQRDNAKTYLLLKDIFPQNAVDLGMMRKNGVSGFIYKYFRRKEKQLYLISDYIGCMSPANQKYILDQNPYLSKEKVGVCPNSIEPHDMSASEQEKEQLRNKYGIPVEKTVFIYGGNLGKPQGIPFVIDCLKSQLNNPKAYFVIVGDGTEFGKLESFISSYKPDNVRLLQRLSQEDYEKMVSCCDVGLIFLDYRFTIPNFPSRLLGYMEAKLPILAVVDRNTDIGNIIVTGNFGWKCYSDKVENFKKSIIDILNTSNESRLQMSANSWNYMLNNYTSEKGFKTISNSLSD